MFSTFKLFDEYRIFPIKRWGLYLKLNTRAQIDSGTSNKKCRWRLSKI